MDKTHGACHSSQQNQLLPSEWEEVKKHRAFMTTLFGRDVDEDEALEHWLRHHALPWREARQRMILALQREEMLRHKWIESEKAQRDLGTDALLDWIRQYAAQWRDELDHQGLDVPDS